MQQNVAIPSTILNRTSIADLRPILQLVSKHLLLTQYVKMRMNFLTYFPSAEIYKSCFTVSVTEAS